MPAVITKPLNPERAEAALLKLKIPADAVKVPVPLRVPLRVILLGMVGEAPNGNEQLVATVFAAVLLKMTKLNVTLLQPKFALPPSKVTVPPLALKVGEPEIVNAPAIVIVPLGAVKPPELKIKVLFKSTVV